MDAETLEVSDALPVLHADEITLDDGRRLVYYTFDFDEDEGN